MLTQPTTLFRSPTRLLIGRTSRLRADLAAIVPLVLLLVAASPATAQFVVGGCTEDDFRSALEGGGDVAFEEDCVITLTSPIIISDDTSIDADGNNVTISGGGGVQLFSVDPEVTLTLLNLTIANGLTTNGGGIYVNEGAALVASDCI